MRLSHNCKSKCFPKTVQYFDPSRSSTLCVDSRFHTIDTDLQQHIWEMCAKTIILGDPTSGAIFVNWKDPCLQSKFLSYPILLAACCERKQRNTLYLFTPATCECSGQCTLHFHDYSHLTGLFEWRFRSYKISTRRHTLPTCFPFLRIQPNADAIDKRN